MVDIWSLAEQEAAKEQQLVQERTMVICGETRSGKTTFLLNFLNQTREKVSSTVALEYTYARRQAQNSNKRDVAHLYELAGTQKLSQLLITPFSTPQSLASCTITIVLDLSSPWSILYSKQLIEKQAKGSILKSNAFKTLQKHPDFKLMNPFPVNLVIIANKYDVFENEDSEKRKWMAKALRFFAHKNGAYLVYQSQKDTKQQQAAKSILNHLLFGTQCPKLEQKDHSQPIVVLPGNDSFDQIGQLQGQGLADETKWINGFRSYFPAPEEWENPYEVQQNF